MKFSLEIQCDNAAFASEAREGLDPEACRLEVSRILKEAADKVLEEPAWGHLRDHNGNRVGRFDFDANR